MKEIWIIATIIAVIIAVKNIVKDIVREVQAKKAAELEVSQKEADINESNTDGELS